MGQTINSDRPIHVLTLTPFYPLQEDEAKGCFIAEPLPWLEPHAIKVSVFAVQPLSRGWAHPNDKVHPATSINYLAPPGNAGLSVSGLFLFARILAKVRKLHRVSPIDLVHAHAALPCGHAAALLARTLGIPFVVTVHGNDAYLTNQIKGSAGCRCKRISEAVYGAARRVICVSGAVAERVRENPNLQPRISVVYNGVDESVFCPAEEIVENRILSVGNLISTKGHELLIRAFALEVKNIPGMSLEIIGEGPERQKLMELTRELGIGDKVDFLGKRSRLEVANALKRSSIFALPSRDEALGCVYLEAMAAARPAVACKRQGIEEIIQHGVNGWLIEPEDLSAMTEALSRLASDEILRRKIGREARLTILRDYTFAHQAERLAAIYRESL